MISGQLHGSTGTGKSTVATYSMCYELYKLMCLKNPNRFYLGANETIWMLFFNLNLKLAEKTMWGKFQKALQMSPWFMERGTVTGRTNLIYQPNKDIKLGIGSTEEHALSIAVMFVGIDEMSFGENDNVDYTQANMMRIYNQLYLRLSSRFSKAGRIQGRMYLISSAKSTNAVLESFIKDNEGQPGMHVSRYKQWEVLPASKFSGKWFKIAVGNELLTSYIMGVNVTEQQIKDAEMQGYTVIDVPLEMKHRFEMDFNRTLIDSCGISVQSSYKYIPYRIVEPCIGTGKNPFISEIIKTGLADNYKIKDFFLPDVVPELLYSKKIYIHCDLSKSGDMTGISGVAVLGYKNQERYSDDGNSNTIKEMVFKHVFSVGIQCPANDELSMIKIKDFLHYLKYELGWNICGVSCDGYQSLMLLQSLKLDGFNVKEVSMDILKNKECVGYTILRNVLVEQRIKLLKLNELIKETTNLEKNETTGKIDHPKQCLAGDTKIRIKGNKSKTILQLLKDFKNGKTNYVLSYNILTHKQEYCKLLNVWYTGKRNDIYKITFDNDKYVICTSNHPFLLDGNTYMDAKYLETNNILKCYDKKVNIKSVEKLIDVEYDVYDLEIENTHNFALDCGIFVHNSIKILDDGTKVKSVGKDIVDSLGGAIYNATLSVNLTELDYLDAVIMTDTLPMLNPLGNDVNNMFGITIDPTTNTYKLMNSTEEDDIDKIPISDYIDTQIQEESEKSQNILNNIKSSEPNTKLSNDELLNLYDNMFGDNMIII